MRSLPFFIVFICAVVLCIEGLGLGREVTYLSILLVPSTISVLMYFGKRKEIVISTKFLLVWMLFLFVLSISTVFSVNLERSVDELAYWFIIMFVSCIVLDMRQELRQPIIMMILSLGIIFSGYSLLLRLFPTELSFLIPQHTYQYVADPFRLNNVLGTFLVIPLVMLLPYVFHKRSARNKIVFGVLLVFFLMSGTRAAYAGFAITTGVYLLLTILLRKSRFNKTMIGYSLLIILPVLLFFLTVRTENAPDWYTSLSTYVVEITQSPPYESFLSSRQYYAEQAFKGFIERPVWGWGPGNFYYASIRYTQTPILSTYVSENIILDELVETGFIGILALSLLFATYASSAWRVLKEHQDIPNTQIGLAAFSMTVMMMGDSLTWWYGLFLVFFVFLSLLSTKENSVRIPFVLVALLSLIPFLYFQMKVLSRIAFIHGEYELSHSINPLEKDSYLPLMIQYKSEGDGFKYARLMKKAEALFKGDPEVLYMLGFAYAGTDKDKAAEYLQKSFYVYPVQYFDRARDAYYLMKRLKGVEESRQFFLSYVNNYIQSRNFAYKTKRYDVYRDANIMHLCMEEGFSCKFIYSNEMIVERVE